MFTRRVALPLAALTALATMPVLIEAAPAGASGAVVQPSPASRGRSGDHRGSEKKAEEPQNNCPTTLWTVPLEIKGLACLLLLPKPEKQGQGGEGSGGGGGLLG
ncbi:MAG TPA: hypothetical protein VFE55_05460 [Acidimicrobiia bacterium]|nr:hypothetical protein [Acidimicrobiia bacterium]